MMEIVQRCLGEDQSFDSRYLGLKKGLNDTGATDEMVPRAHRKMNVNEMRRNPQVLAGGEKSR
jgi:hypothetical protein